MDPVSNVDRLVLILRQKLEARARAAGGRSGVASRKLDQPPRGVEAVHALAAVEGVEDRQLRRAFIQSALAEQLGPQLLNDGSFQQVVERVTDTLEQDPVAGPALARIVRELRAAAR